MSKSIFYCFFIFTSVSCFSQVSTCNNADFERGDFSGWNGQLGSCCPISTSPSGITSGRQTIMTGTGTDANTCNLITVVAPGSVYSARLGNDNTGAEAEKLSYSLTVSASNSLFIYKYAVILEDPGHPVSDQPRFEVRVLNASGAVIDPTCGVYTVVASSSLPGWQTCNGVVFKDWTTVGLDLSAYIGQILTIEFATGDCSQGGHFGYAYVDAYFSPLAINNGYCSGSNSATLAAPIGFTYLWNTGATTQTIVVPNPVQGLTYTCTLTSVTGCTVNISTVMQPADIAANFALINTCYTNADFSDTSVTPPSSPVRSSLWNFGDGTTSTVAQPTHAFPSAGNYTVSLAVTNSSGCTSVSTQSITVIPPATAVLSYATPFCADLTTPQAVTVTGTLIYLGGVFSSTAGLSINTSTGAINPSASIPGTYVVTYDLPTSNVCTPIPVATSVTINAVPTAVLNYGGATLCTSLSSASVNLSGTGAYTGGNFSSTTGLSIDASTGTITPSASSGGTYTITYSIPARSGCAAVTFTTSVTITFVPAATVTYPAAAFCVSLVTPQAVTLTGVGAYTGGTYTSSSSLSINASTGTINPGASSPGTYNVRYIIPTTNACIPTLATTLVTITAVPTAVISYGATALCTTQTLAKNVNRTGTGAYIGGVYSSTTGLSIDPTTGAITPSTSAGGTYTVSYVIPASGGCSPVTVTTSVTITFVPTATISYPGGPFCNSLTATQSVIQSGTGAYTGGVFSSTTGLTLDPATGEIIPATSTVGTYSVSYKIPWGLLCPPLLATTNVTIKPTPAASCLPAVICGTQSTNLSITSTIPSSTFLWTVAQNDVSGASSSTGSVISQVLNTTGSTQGTALYTITPSFNGCDGSPINTIVTVNPLPQPQMENGAICVNEATGIAYKTFTFDTLLSTLTYSFAWYFPGTSVTPITGATNSTYVATQIGQYSVVATNIATNCSSPRVSADITQSFPGIAIISTESTLFTDDATIVVQGGNGHYEYQLNGGPFQTSNVFTNLSSGNYTVVVIDTEGCTNLTKDFTIIHYPVFFSPNNDGYHDYWNIFDLYFQPDTKIYIYDRQGKMIKQITTTGSGWDGTYNGKPLPSEDYWFIVDYVEMGDRKVFKSHFSLKR